MTDHGRIGHRGQEQSISRQGKSTRYIDDLPAAFNPEAIRAARVLLQDVSNRQYTGEIERGLEYHPSVLTLTGGVPVSKVDATEDWVHLAALVEMIKGIKRNWINHMPFYLRGLVRMVPMNQMHQILLYAALTNSKANIQIGIDASAYIWVRARQFHDELHKHHDEKGELIAFHHDGQFYKSCPFITALFTYTEVPRTTKRISMSQLKTSSCHWTDAPSHVHLADQVVLALRIKAQNAQQFGMIDHRQLNHRHMW